jgi:hypothetical protein
MPRIVIVILIHHRHKSVDLNVLMYSFSSKNWNIFVIKYDLLSLYPNIKMPGSDKRFEQESAQIFFIKVIVVGRWMGGAKRSDGLGTNSVENRSHRLSTILQRFV